MMYIKRGIHLDFHTMPGIQDFGSEFDGREFAKTLKETNVDYINVFAKCNIGFAYYPTRIGIVYPNLKFDMFGEIVRECHALGIGVSAYFNAGLDHEQARRHREWCVLTQNGQVSRDDKFNNFFREMCFNSGYGDYLIDLIKEIQEMYPVDGIFLDCMYQPPCYGHECMEIMISRDMDVLDPDKVREFMESSKYSFAERVKNVVGGEKLLYFNGLSYGGQKNFASHFELECLPTGGWGYDLFPTNVKYTRCLGKQVIGMTARFHKSWADFGGIRSKASLEYDCYNAISNAAACSVGDHLHPRGRLEKDVYKLIGDVFGDIKGYEPWTDYAKAVTEIGIVVPKTFTVSSDPSTKAKMVQGATRMLSELFYQFDIVDEDMELGKYKVLVLPDEVKLSENLSDKLKQYIAKGGGIISSGYSGLDENETDFAIKEWGIEYIGPETWNETFFKMKNNEFCNEIPDFPISIYGQGIAVKILENADMLAEVYQPYFNRHWDGFHGYVYIPPCKGTGRPMLVRSGSIYHFNFNIFTSYFDTAYVIYKQLAGECLKQLLPEPVVTVKNVPSYGRVTVTGKGDMNMVHVLVYCPELRGSFQVIEEPGIANDVELSFKADNVKKVYVAPEREELDFLVEDGYVKVRLPVVRGYKMIVFE